MPAHGHAKSGPADHTMAALLARLGKAGQAGPVGQGRPGWPGRAKQAWLDKLWHAWRDISAMTFPACPGTAAARTLRDLSVHELGLVAVLLKPDTTVSCTLFGQQHVKESKGIVLNFIVESKLHQTA